MKRIIPFFVVCLGLSVFQTAGVVGAETTKNKRDSGNTVTTINSASRSNQTTKTESNKSDKSRTTVKTSRNNQSTSLSKGTAVSRQTVKPRSTQVSVNSVKPRITTVSRNTETSRSIEPRNNAKKTTVSRTATGVRKSATRTKTTRAAQLNDEKITDIKSRDYSKCKTVYYDCMDEFCANKDTDLRRCACSSRIHEFDDIKKQLTNAEDKMLDFNQQLLLVGLDKEDAAAVNVATEGEEGFSTKDSSKSEKLLKTITKSLNTSNDSRINNNMSSVSLSLDMDSAWDSIDSLSGISTSAKNGLDLYNAAKPVCIEMAQEVCSEDELDIAQNSYKLLIQQDCNTVAKTYDAKYNQAMEKIHESGALLDMARLNAYQQRNSDDILTCKKKILEQLSESSVCGENLHKCLDLTGQYINPYDGTAFLTTNLYNLTTLLTEPVGEETWSKVPQNDKFVSFLNSKKMFLKSATDQCQDISDVVWKDFLNDALAQIKLAQNAKLEEIRQSCTTLVAECKSGAHQSLEDFDARALSTFQVITDSTVNALCADVQQSCTSLLNSSGGGGTQWETGMVGVSADISYDAILENCVTVGKDCIIQQCNGTSGNFALCADMSSNPRRAILTRQACWNEVLSCVRQSTNLNNITNIVDIIKKGRPQYYQDIYGSNINFADIPCGNDVACLITEQIWGNCERNATETAISTNQTLVSAHPGIIFDRNKILIPTEEENDSLLSWLAYNTGTTDTIDSCSAYNCPVDYLYDSDSDICKQMVPDNILTTSDGHSIITTDEKIYVTNSLTNYCAGGRNSKDMYGNCCASGATSNGICVPDASYSAVFLQDAYCNTNQKIAASDVQLYYCADATETDELNASDGLNLYMISDNKRLSLYCVAQHINMTVNNNGQFSCSGGYIVLVDQYGNYIKPHNMSGPTMSYKSGSGTCTYSYSGHTWGFSGCNNGIESVPKNNRFMITY